MGTLGVHGVAVKALGSKFDVIGVARISIIGGGAN